MFGNRETNSCGEAAVLFNRTFHVFRGKARLHSVPEIAAYSTGEHIGEGAIVLRRGTTNVYSLG